MKKFFLIVVLLIGILFTVGCQTEEHPEPKQPTDIPVTVPNTDKPDAVPTLTDIPVEPLPSEEPVPTQICDSPVERYNADIQPRTAEQEIPLVYSIPSAPKSLNPIYYSKSDSEFLELTQIKLFGSDENGNATAGIVSDGLAYSVFKLDDSTELGIDSSVFEKYDAYRIVLKEGIRFADGEPVTVDDVWFTIYSLADRNYRGASDIRNLPVMGMKEYSTQVPEAVRAQAELALAGGINADGTMPLSCKMQSSRWHEVWDYYNEAGINMTGDIVEYVNKNYNYDPYVNAFLSTNLTYAHVAADESLRVAYAMAFWGFVKSYKTSTNILKDYLGTEHNLNEEKLTVETFWNLINSYHGYDMDSLTGVNYEVAPDCGKTFEDYIADAFFEDRLGVESITGISLSKQDYSDGAVRNCIDVLIEKGSDISKFNFYVAEKAFYEENPHSDDLHGAGRYLLTDVYTGIKEDEAETEFTRLEFTANNEFFLGSPETHYIIFTTETEIPVEEPPVIEEDGNEVD